MKKQGDNKMQEKWLFLGIEGEIEKIVSEKPTLEEMQEWVGGYIEYTGAEKDSNFFVNTKKSMESSQGDLNRLKVMKQNVIDIIVNEEGLLMNLEPNYIATAAKYNLSYLDMQIHDITPLVGNVIIHYEATDEPRKGQRHYSVVESACLITGIRQEDSPIYGDYGRSE